MKSKMATTRSTFAGAAAAAILQRALELLAERVPHLMRRMHNGIARGVGPVAKAMADVIETAANMALAKIIAGRVEIPLRTGAVGIAGGKDQWQGQQAQAGQSHINGSFRPSSRPSGDKFQYYGVGKPPKGNPNPM